jgi:hypothetical protein
MMSESIYHTKVSPRLQAAVRKAAVWSEFTYKDDPQFAVFCNVVCKEVEYQNIERTGRNGPELDAIRKNKVYGVWYTASTFRNHWQHPTKRSENDMLWILYNRGWSQDQGRVAIVAWWRIHHRKFTTATLDELDRLADRVWNEVQEKKMKKKMEAKQNSLRNRILTFLRQQPATTAYLAEKLNATSKAVDSHLYRFRKEGIVERLSWGLYALRQRTGTVVGTTHQARPQQPPAIDSGRFGIAPFNLDDVEDGVAEARGLPSLPARSYPTLESDGMVSNPLELPTAEPRWSRL